MTTPVVVPGLGLNVSEVTLLEWAVPAGSAVAAGDIIATIETDKVETELEAPAAGTLSPIGEPGGTYSVGAVIGEIVGG